MSELRKKVDKAIKMMRDLEPLSLDMCSSGFNLGFSGGKDSVVLYFLAKMSGVKFTSNMSITTIDPPEVMRFIRQKYPDTIFHHPDINFYNLIKQKKTLPTRLIRYCCSYLKEQQGAGTITLLGIRKAESQNRNKRKEIEISNRKYSQNLDQFNINKEHVISCVSGRDKILVSPILDFSDKEIYQFIQSEKIEVCELYYQGYYRIGCLFCPMSNKKSKILDYKNYPKVADKIISSIQYLMDNNHYFNNFPKNSAEDIFHWWISDTSSEKFFSNLNYPKLFHHLPINL